MSVFWFEFFRRDKFLDYRAISGGQRFFRGGFVLCSAGTSWTVFLCLGASTASSGSRLFLGLLARRSSGILLMGSRANY